MTFLTEDLKRELVALRRDFHQYPELALQEQRSAGKIADFLRRLELDSVETEVGVTGVVGRLRGRGGRVVMLRADMDGLPLLEEDRGQPYRSRTDGKHHACGHDGHMAILLTTAKILAARRHELPGDVVFLFQPAEETVGGAERMLAAGALNDSPPDACYGLHLWNSLPVGTVHARDGAVFANADAFRLVLRGPGGHGAMPHQTSDPIVASAQLVTVLQTLVSRDTDPLAPAALTIGSIHGGTAPNIIPSSVELHGTLRTFDDDLREKLLGRIKSVLEGITSTFRLEGQFELFQSCPAAVNNPAHAALVREVARELLGPEAVGASARTTGGDDMALFLREAPGCYFFVGSSNSERGLDSPHHSPAFDFDERALEIGTELMVGITLAALAGPPRVGG